MRFKKTILLSVAAIGLLSGRSALADVIGHDRVQQIWSGASELEAYYAPMFIKGGDSCNPYPGVDQWGNVSGGLAPSGAPDGHCRSESGQVYSRKAEYHGKCAIMYSFYFPKDQPPNWLGTGPGHRHDWENIVVWLNGGCWKGASIYKINYSNHGSYTANWNPPTWTGQTGLLAWGVHPKVTVKATYAGFADHVLDSSNGWGYTMPLVGWDNIPQAAKNALNWYDFGAANVPHKDGGSFWNNLNKAWDKN
ncbi:MAG: NPP1 family protein [Pseudomonadota bacterium]